MIKIDYPKLSFKFTGVNKKQPITMYYRDKTYVLDNNSTAIEVKIETLNDVHEIKFSDFIPNDKSQKVTVQVFCEGIEKESESLCTFLMKKNPYVENTSLRRYNQIHFNGSLTIKFFKRWFEYNFLDGAQIIDIKNMPPVQHINNGYWYHDNCLRIDLKIKTYDIVCLGCSFTEGSGLLDEQTWPKILESKVRKSVGNFGVGGSGIDSIYRQFIYTKKHFDPEYFLILLPNFERVRYKFKFGDHLCETLLSVGHMGPFEKKSQMIFIKTLQEAKTLGLKYIKRLSRYNNVKMSSWSTDVYNNIPKKNRLSPYPDLKMFKERAPDGEHPSEKHNNYFVNSLLKEDKIDVKD